MRDEDTKIMIINGRVRRINFKTVKEGSHIQGGSDPMPLGIKKPIINFEDYKRG
jgi:hypothetical protein